MESKKNYYRLIAPGILLLLLIIFISQNLRIIEVNFLFWDGNMRLINLVLVSFIIGAMCAWAISYYRRYKKKNKAIEVEVVPDDEDKITRIESTDDKG